MPTTLQHRRYSTSALSSITGANGEIIIDSDKDIVTVHDGSTAGGFPLAPAGAYDQANNARNQANTARDQANSAYGEANLKLNLAGGTISGDLVVSGNLEVLGNTTTLNVETLSVEDNEIILNSNVTGAPTLNAFITINRGSANDVSVKWDEGSGQWKWADDDQVYYAFDTALDAYAGANGAYAQANGAYGQANGAYGQANGAYASANGAYAQANGAYGQANGAYGQANVAYAQANAAYNAANNAQVTVYANNASGKTTQFINFANTATIQVAVIADGSNANVEFVTIGDSSAATVQGAYGQANTARDQANNAYGQANDAYGQANSAYSQANGAYAQANAAYGNANTRVLKAGDIMTGVLNVAADIHTNNIFINKKTDLSPPSTANQVGERLRLYDFNNPGQPNYAIGVEGNHIWTATDDNTGATGFKWYGNTTQAAILFSNGSLALSNTVEAKVIRANGTGTAIDAGSGNILTNKVTGTKFVFLAGANTVNVDAVGATANYTFTLPANSGLAGQLLVTDGSGLTTFSSDVYAHANIAYAQANTARDTANDAYGQANTARTTANDAYGAANTGATNALNAYGQANDAYAQANTARGTANDSYGQANAAYGQANAAYNAANNAQVTVYQNSASAVTTQKINFVNTATITVSVTNESGNANVEFTAVGGAAYDQANAAYNQANTARGTANDAYGQANTARDQANTAYGQANDAYGQANTARNQANNAYGEANLKLNLTGGTISGNLTVQGNLFLTGNATYINTSSLIVDDPLIQLSKNSIADAVDIGFIGHYSPDGGTTNLHAGIVRHAADDIFYAFDGYAVEPTNNIIDVGSATLATFRANIFNAAHSIVVAGVNVLNTANGAYAQANGAYAQANGAYAHANVVYAQANTAYNQANSARDQANTARTTANDAYGAANTAQTNALNAYGQANSARDQANTAYGQANTARTTANDAYGAANTAQTNALGAYAHANIVYAQANTAYNQANSARDQANTARTTANDAYGEANTAETIALNAYAQANTARNTANSAYGQANNAYTTANAAVVASGGTATTLTLKAYREGINTRTITGSTVTADLSGNNIFDFTLQAAAVTVTFTNAAASGNSHPVTLLLRQPGTAGNTVAYANTVNWSNAEVPTLASGIASRLDIISLVTVDGGTTYFAAHSMANVAY